MSLTVDGKLKIFVGKQFIVWFFCHFNEYKMCKKMQFVAGNHRRCRIVQIPL